MRKRLLVGLLIAAVLLLGGCDVIYPLLNGTLTPKVDADKYAAQFHTNPQYIRLDESDQARYGTLYTVLTDGFAEDEQVTVDSTTYYGVRVPLSPPITDQAQARHLYDAFFWDNPRFFYVGGSYELEGYMKRDTPCYDTLVLTYTMDATTRRTAQTALDTAVQELMQGCPDTKDAYVTELYLHDQLAKRCTYSDKAVSAGFGAYPNAFNAYGALVEGEAVCEGYSRAMQLLLERCGIPCTLVMGHSLETNEKHMWNLVTINGNTYHLDVTWDDSDDILRHTFFNLTTALLQQTHVLDKGQDDAATCTATTDNYFVRQKAYIDSYDRDVIARAIAVGFAAGQEIIELRFAPDKYDNGLLFLKNQRLTQTMTKKYIASGEPLWNYELMGDAACHVLTLIKKD